MDAFPSPKLGQSLYYYFNYSSRTTITTTNLELKFKVLKLKNNDNNYESRAKVQSVKHSSYKLKVIIGFTYFSYCTWLCFSYFILILYFYTFYYQKKLDLVCTFLFPCFDYPMKLSYKHYLNLKRVVINLLDIKLKKLFTIIL